MRIHTIGLASALLIAAATASQASTPDAGGDIVSLPSNAVGVSTAKNASDDVVIARRGRGGDDPAGDDHGRRHGGKGKGGKGRGGNDDGSNHNRNDDHGVHGPNHP